MLGAGLSLGSFLVDVAARLYPESKEISSAAKTAGAIQHSYDVLSTSSVHQSARRTMIAPMVVIEQGLLQQEFMGDLMQVITVRDIVATLTHIQLQGSVSMGVKVDNIIGGIQPNRAGLLSFSGLESLDTSFKPAVADADKPEKGAIENTVSIGGKSYADINEYTPLAVGKTVIATINTDNGGKIEVPLTFREIPVPSSPADLMLTFSAAKAEDGAKARLLMVKTKEITGPEFLSGFDIVKERFKIKNEEMSGYYKEALNRDTNNKLAAIRTGLVSLNTLANSFVLSSDVAKQIELKTGKRFADPASREGIFKAVKANTIVVCNEDKGTYVFYTIGQSIPELYTRRDLASKSKKDTSSSSLADLVKLLNGGM